MKKIKKELFPIFNNNPNLIYLDNAATTQKPQIVLDTMNYFYTNINSNIHRGLYEISEKANILYDKTRNNIAKFINAKRKDEIIFTSGSTDSLNLLANTISISNILNKDDEIFLNETEHHSNFLPWYNMQFKNNIKIKYIPIDNNGNLDYNWIEKNISNKTKIITITGMSNVLGTKTDIKKITNIAHKYNTVVVIDASQLIAHNKIDVIDDDIDFLTFSSHKLYGPTGVGVLYGKYDLLLKLSPYKLGGDMVNSVSIGNVKYSLPPTRFEAGTQPIAEVIGLSSAIDFINEIGFDYIEKYEKDLTKYAINELKKIKEVKIISDINSNSIISFIVQGISSFDIGMMLGAKNICVRVGKHCAEPLHNKLNIENSIRISIGIYNDKKDIDIFTAELKKIIIILK